MNTQPLSVALSSTFDDTVYLDNNPDVLKAVRSGQFLTGKQHYFLHGFREGRTKIGHASALTVKAPAAILDRRNQADFVFYHTNGFLIVESGLSEKCMDGAIDDLAAIYSPTEQAGAQSNTYGTAYADHKRIQDGWRVSENVMAVACAPAILTTLRMLYGGINAFPFQTLNFKYGSEQKTHSDTVHFNSRPSGLMVGVWVALEDIDYRRGPLVYYPGSHVLPEILTQDIQREDSDMHYGHYEQFIERAITNSAIFQRSHAYLRKGQALIWAANLHHGGSGQLDKKLTRHSQVTHYFFEGSEYWTPRMSRSKAPFIRKPEIIKV